MNLFKITSYASVDQILLNNTEEILPDYVEDHVKSEVPFLSNVVVIGEGRTYLTCLLTLKVNLFSTFLML